MRTTILQAGYCTCPEHLAIQGGRWRGIRFPAMFALFEHPRFGAMLFDSGYSFRFFEETRMFPNRLYRWLTPVTLSEEQLAVNQLSTLNIKPSEITRIFISHFHADHIAGLADFKSARYVYLPQAYEAVRGRRGAQALSRGFIPALIPSDFERRSGAVDEGSCRPLPPEYRPFTKGYDLLGDESLIAVELPGHATGQMGIFARGDQGMDFFFVADAAWLAEAINRDRPPHPVTDLLFSDAEAYRSTLHDLHNYREQHPGVQVIPSHCDATLSHYVAQPLPKGAA